MKQRAIVFDGTLNLIERPAIVLNPGFILVKPLEVYLGFIEKLLTSGSIPLSTPIIPGSMGIAKVIEAYNGDSSIIGKLVVISPFNAEKFLGLERDGLLSNYAVVPSNYIHSVVERPGPYDVMTPLIHHALEIAEKIRETPLILGCELLSLFVGLYSREKGFEPDFICEGDSRDIHRFNFKVLKSISEVPSRMNTLVITTYNPILTSNIVDKTNPEHIVISPFSFTSLLKLPLKDRVIIERVNKFQTMHPVDVGKAVQLIRNYVRTVEVDDVEKTRGLFPPRGLGVIVKYSKLLQTLLNE
ncbi:MAG: hypothetical protein QXF92_01840 [Thermosphaera sp.]